MNLLAEQICKAKSEDVFNLAEWLSHELQIGVPVSETMFRDASTGDLVELIVTWARETSEAQR